MSKRLSIFLVAGASVGSPLTAAAQCPPNLATAPKIVLETEGGNRRTIERRPDGRILSIRENASGSRRSEHALERGYFIVEALELANGVTATGTIEFPPGTFDAFAGWAVDTKRKVETIIKTGVADPRTAVVEVHVRLAERITIGTCTIDTVAVQRTVFNPAGKPSVIYIDNMAPALGFSVRQRVLRANGEIVPQLDETFVSIKVEG